MEEQTGEPKAGPAFLETLKPKKMATKRENSSFIESLFDGILDSAIEWIGDNKQPDEVFQEKALVSWVGNNKTPDEIYDTETLEDWAKENGFVKQ